MVHLREADRLTIVTMNVAKNYDLVFLFGPPLFDKSAYLPESFFRKDYLLLVPKKLFEENPVFGLRDVSLRIVSELKKDKQVFVEDDLHSRNSRKSILNTVNKKIPKCRVLLVKVIPNHGYFQLQWSHLNAHGRGALQTCSCQNESSHAKHWFNSSLQSIDYSSGFVDAPEENEGFELMEIEATFQVQSDFKYEVPALFTQWEAAVSDSGNLNEAFHNICEAWVKSNKCGRIILISDGKAENNLSCKEKAALQFSLNQLAVKIDCPVFILKLARSLHINSFCLPPKPGILAFLQTRHLIDLQSKHTLYIFETSSHMKMAQAAGVKIIKSLKAFRYPQKVLSNFCMNSYIPDMLRDVKVVKDNEHKTPQIPLFEECMKSEEFYVSQSHQNGLEEHVFSPGTSKLLKFQENFVSLITPVDMPGSKMASLQVESESKSCSNELRHKFDGKKNILYENLPIWMNKRLTRKSTESSASTVDSEDQTSSFRFSRTVYIMSEKELKEISFSVMSQAGKTVSEIVNKDQNIDDGHGS